MFWRPFITLILVVFSIHLIRYWSQVVLFEARTRRNSLLFCSFGACLFPGFLFFLTFCFIFIHQVCHGSDSAASGLRTAFDWVFTFYGMSSRLLTRTSPVWLMVFAPFPWPIAYPC